MTSEKIIFNVSVQGLILFTFTRSKVKASLCRPGQAWTGPEVSRRIMRLEFIENLHMNGAIIIFLFLLLHRAF